jgi:hypothetical protein
MRPCRSFMLLPFCIYRREGPSGPEPPAPNHCGPADGARCGRCPEISTLLQRMHHRFCFARLGICVPRLIAPTTALVRPPRFPLGASSRDQPAPNRGLPGNHLSMYGKLQLLRPYGMRPIALYLPIPFYHLCTYASTDLLPDRLFHGIEHRFAYERSHPV